MRTVRILGQAFLCVFALSACGGKASTNALPGSAVPVVSSDSQVVMKITGLVAAQKTRRAKYVSPDTNGAVVKSYSGATASGTPVSTVAIDLSSSSTLCTSAGGYRVCTFKVGSATGTASFEVDTYDTAQSNSSTGETFNPSAAPTGNLLGRGYTNGLTVAASGTTTIPIVIGGQPASVAMIPLVTSGDGTQPASYPLGVSAYDADGNLIIAGQSDTYSTPVTLTVGEHGTFPKQSGATTLSYVDPFSSPAPATGVSSVSVYHSGDGTSLVYAPPTATPVSSTSTMGLRRKIATAAAAAPYYAAIVPSVGTNPTALTFNPIFVSDSDTSVFTQNDPTPQTGNPNGSLNYPLLTLSGSDSTSTVTILEHAYTGAFTPSASTGCSGFATVSAVPSTSNMFMISGSGSSGRAKPPAQPLTLCTVSFADASGASALLEVAASLPTVTPCETATNQGRKTIFLCTASTGTYFQAPSDIDTTQSVAISTIGAGGSGPGVGYNNSGGGGGGGAFASVQATLTPGAYYLVQVGSGGNGPGAGDTYFCFTGKTCDLKTASENTEVGAQAGTGGAGATGGAGGSTSSSVGTLLFPGGTGGAGHSGSSLPYSAGGGGGAAGPNGAGTAGFTYSGSKGGNGGNGGGTGTNTGGAGGSGGTSCNGGGPGVAGSDLSMSTGAVANYGSGGGGGGANGGAGSCNHGESGGAGGAYGGGGGGGANNGSAGQGGSGAGGLIVITYTVKAQ